MPTFGERATGAVAGAVQGAVKGATGVEPLQIQRLNPAEGDASGGYEVVIMGTGLGNVVTVKFGDEKATDVSAEDSVVTCEAPVAYAPKPVKVTCLDKNGHKSNELSFMYLPG